MADRNRAELVIAVCAVLTSAIAVFIAWDQGRVMRAQQHGAVFPVLQVDGFTSRLTDRLSLGIRISNTGVGPALIERVGVRRGDEVLETLKPYRASLPGGYNISYTSLTGRSLAPGSQVTALEISWPEDKITEAEFYAVAADWSALELELCYCSVFDRCWLARDLAQQRPVRTKMCERGDKDIFEEAAQAQPSPPPKDLPPEVEP